MLCGTTECSAAFCSNVTVLTPLMHMQHVYTSCYVAITFSVDFQFSNFETDITTRACVEQIKVITKESQ